VDLVTFPHFFGKMFVLKLGKFSKNPIGCFLSHLQFHSFKITSQASLPGQFMISIPDAGTFQVHRPAAAFFM